ncbi:MAG TPA: ABC transporter permease [Mycobacteriales bacterium]|nr:ABC transporter permease [Mycobacteriales bacterium]
MFSILYVLRELRRRVGRTVLTALGLALGVGLVIGIMGVSQGLDDAQDRVLAPLGSVGTDILVTRVVGTTTAASASPSAQPTAPARAQQPGGGPAGGGFFGGGGGGGGRAPGIGGLDQADAQALLAENSNVVTDLAKLGKPGETFTRDFFLSATLLSFPEDAVEQVAALPGVDSAVGGLVQLAQHQTGTVPEIVASIQTGGQTFTQTVRPDPPTEAERSAMIACFAANGGGRQGPGASPGPGQPGGGGGALDQCLPARFREFRAQFTTPIQTLRQVIDPPSTDITNVSYTAAGVDPAHPEVGLITTQQLVSGRWIAPTAANEVLLSVAYANTKSITVGASLPINGTSYAVVGLVSPTLTGSTADVYFPIATLQELAGKDGRITQVLVKASDAESVDEVAAGIKTLLPGAEVVTTAELADQVTGSLSDARDLAARLGTALAVIVLAAAFAIAVLLTLSSIGKRVREIGTLRAIGWSKGRVVRQLLGETLVIGLLGGLMGLAIGFGVAEGVESMSPALSATSTGVPGVTGSTLAELFGRATATAQTTEIPVTAPLHATTLALGVAFALVGGLLAGLAGGWRAARLSPAVALRNLG